MQEKSSKKNMIVIGVIILAIAVAAYFYATRDQSSSDLLLTEPAGAGLAVDGDLISALSSLRRLNLNDEIFRSPAWGTLFDFSQSIPPQEPGRPNPFAPFPGAAVVVPTTP